MTKVFEQQDEKVKVTMDRAAARLNEELHEFGYRILTHEIVGAGYFIFIQHPSGEYPHNVFSILESQRRNYKRSNIDMNYFVSVPKDEEGKPRPPYIPFVQSWMVKMNGTKSGD